MRNRIGKESERTGTARQKDLSEGRRSKPSQPTAIRSLGLLVVATLAGVFVLRAGWLACATPPTDLRPAAIQAREAVLVRAPKTGDGGNLPCVFPSQSPQVSPQVPSQVASLGRLSTEDFAMLSSVCPTSIDSLPPELLPFPQKGKAEGGRMGSVEADAKVKLAPPHRLTADHSSRASQPARRTTARITGVRVASRPDWSRRPVRLAQADPTTESSSDEGWLVSPDVWFVPEDREKELPQQQEAEQQEEADQQESNQQEPEQQEAEQQESEPATVPVENREAEPPAMLPQAEPKRAWPVLPPRPGILPERKVPVPFESQKKIASPTPMPPLPPELTLSLPDLSQGPLLSEPDFLTEPKLLAEPESQVHEGFPELTPKTKPLFAAPLIEPAKKKTNELPATEQPAREPPVLAPPAPVQVPENLPTPESAPEAPSQEEVLPKAEEKKEPSKEIVPPPAMRSPRPMAETLAPTIESKSTEPLLAPARPTAPANLFAPPVATPPVASSVHGAGAAVAARKAAGGKSADLSHAELFSQNCYPSAKDCAKCHEKIYDEWSLSSHAYAYVSPMFHKFEQKINDLSQGTVGTFCLRCHSPPGISMAPLVGQTRTTPIAQVSEVSRDGVGCISCHRVNERYGKVNGERRVVTGNLFDPVYGGLGGDGVAAAIADKTKYKLKTSASEKGPGQDIHNEGRFFDQLTRSEACVSCHQVAVHPGIKLEVVWEQYRASPACKKGVSCQDCHMGRVPGVPSGYNYGPIAEVAGKTVRTDRKQSNHSFYGPGYSIAHPGIFPQHQKSDRWNIDQWMLFDWRAGWGTEEFEDRIEEAEDAGQNVATMFPPIWREVDDRYDARDIIDDNLEKLKIKHRQREMVMENGSKVDGPFFGDAPVAGQDLKFEYIVTNLNEGHNLPTASLGAQPQLWANIVLIGPDGRRVWESGYTDSFGDVCDIHSEDVQKGRAPYDSQLFNLQTMFMITGATGTDREFFLPVNLSIDQLAQLRPSGLPVSVLNHPPFIRMENRSIAPLGKKRAKYRVPAEVMCQPGHYRLSFRLRSRLEPMYFMRFVGATEEMQRAMTEGILDVHPMSVEFEVKAPLETARQPAMNEGWMR